MPSRSPDGLDTVLLNERIRCDNGELLQLALGDQQSIKGITVEGRQRIYVEGLFRCVWAHLAPGGTCILNVFHPQGGFERVRQEWERVPEVCVWEATVDGVRLRCEDRGGLSHSVVDPLWAYTR